MRMKLWAIFVFLGVITNVALADDVILRVTGDLTKSSASAPTKTAFTLKDFQEMPNTVVKATTAFTGPATFKGPLLRDVLKRAGIKSNATEVLAIALDGYRVKIPVSELTKYEVIGAYEMNGKVLKPANRGPIWIMYPLDKYPKELSSEATETRLVWSLIELKIE